MSPRHLASRADVLSAAGNHPYARFATAHSRTASGVGNGLCVLWASETHFGRLGHGLGDLDDLLALMPAARDLLAGVNWINLPRHRTDRVPPGYRHREDWDLRWNLALPPVQPGEERVADLTDADAAVINELLDAAMPDTAVRPGAGLARRFYGIRDGDTLVACGADRTSAVGHEPGATVGVVGAIAVHPGHRRRGLGAAITAAITRRLAARHGLVVLGQAADNETASRLYPRLGYTGVLPITSVRST